ncbi:MAG: PAC2 family protein [Phycisphaerales bacterium]|nr:MAG: PAC2 family protein [Phycisphaerales bacterium]
MAVRVHHEPQLKDSAMLCGWPGIGNIGINAVDSLRQALRAKEFAEIEPWDFFDPRKVIIEEGLLKDLEFPTNRFYFQRVAGKDLIFFIGQEQPTEGRNRYAEGKKAYRMANMVLDVAEKLNCRRVYTSGAGVAQIHHTARPRVWAVPNTPSLIGQIRQYRNTVLMSDIEGAKSHGVITGLNGLLLGVAAKRGFEAVCLMGEIPYYLQAAPWPWPKGSKSVIEVLAAILGLKIDVSQLDALAARIEQTIETFLDNLYRAEAIPPQVKEEIEKLRHTEPAAPGPITEEEQKRIMEHIDELFHEGGWKGDRNF